MILIYMAEQKIIDENVGIGSKTAKETGGFCSYYRVNLLRGSITQHNIWSKIAVQVLDA